MWRSIRMISKADAFLYLSSSLLPNKPIMISMVSINLRLEQKLGYHISGKKTLLSMCTTWIIIKKRVEIFIQLSLLLILQLQMNNLKNYPFSKHLHKKHMNRFLDQQIKDMLSVSLMDQNLNLSTRRCLEEVYLGLMVYTTNWKERETLSYTMKWRTSWN